MHLNRYVDEAVLVALVPCLVMVYATWPPATRNASLASLIAFFWSCDIEGQFLCTSNWNLVLANCCLIAEGGGGYIIEFHPSSIIIETKGLISAPVMTR